MPLFYPFRPTTSLLQPAFPFPPPPMLLPPISIVEAVAVEKRCAGWEDYYININNICSRCFWIHCRGLVANFMRPLTTAIYGSQARAKFSPPWTTLPIYRPTARTPSLRVRRMSRRRACTRTPWPGRTRVDVRVFNSDSSKPSPETRFYDLRSLYKFWGW